MSSLKTYLITVILLCVMFSLTAQIGRPIIGPSTNPSTSPPPKEVEIPEGRYCIHTSFKSDNNIDVPNAKDEEGALLWMWETNGGDAQVFSISKSNERGYYLIKTKWGRMFDGSGDQLSTKGAGVYGSDNQKWKFYLTFDGYYQIQSKNKKYISLISSDRGHNIRLKSAINGAFTNWRVVKYYNPYVSISKERKESYEHEGLQEKKEENGMSCTSRRIEFAESNFERIITGGIWDKVYPGVIYGANSVADGSYTTLNMPRNPMTIAVNLISGGARGLAKTLPGNTINRSTVWQEISNLLRQNSGVINASRAVFEMKQIHSAEQLKVFVGGDFSGWGASVQATFKSTSSNSRNVYIVKLTQVYFDVVVDDNQQLTTTLPSDDNALYVHSVSYGKIGYLRVESSESEQTIAASLNARYNWGTGNAGVQANVDYNKVLRESSIVGFTLGGAPIVVSSADQFDQYVKDARWNPSVQVYPIAFKLKFLKDRSDAYVSMTTSYTEKICEPIRRGRVLRVLTQTGSDDLRSYNTAFVTVNYNNGTSSKEYPLLRGQGQNVGATKEVTLDEEIDLVNVRSISIRHDGTPNNDILNGGDAFHTYDNWDLIALRITLLTTNRQQVNIYNSQLTSVAKDKVPIKFSGEKRIAEFLRQL